MSQSAAHSTESYDVEDFGDTRNSGQRGGPESRARERPEIYRVAVKSRVGDAETIGSRGFTDLEVLEYRVRRMLL